MQQTTELSEKLAQLFRDAGSAHHRAFLATNGEDPEWPRWYAEWLAPRMHALLGRQLGIAELARQLESVEEQRKSRRISDWPTYYANWFVSANLTSRP
jgi:hypothetical protein